MQNNIEVTKALFCPVTSLPVTTCDPWFDTKIAPDFTVNYGIVGESIIYIAPVGSATLKGIQASIQFTQIVIEKAAHTSGSFILIYDFLGLQEIAIEARGHYIRQYAQNERMIALIYCNVSPLLKIGINLGQRLNASNRKMHIVDRYSNAVAMAHHICKDRNMTTGPYACEPNIVFDPNCRTLSPVTLLSSDTWQIQPRQFSEKSVVIDNCIQYSKVKGYLRSSDVPYIDRMRESVRKAIPRGSEIEYIVVDASLMMGVNRQARALYMQSIEEWNTKHPIKMYILIGANAFMRAAAYSARMSLNFQFEIVQDHDQAFALIRMHNNKLSMAVNDKPPKVAPLAITQKDIKELLAYIGSVNWEQKGISNDVNMGRSHPLREIVWAIKMIKLELDDLFSERQMVEKNYRELFEKGSDWICVHDLEGNLLETNLAFKTELGLPNKTPPTPNLKDYIPKRYWDDVETYLGNIQRNGHDKGVVRLQNGYGRDVILEYNNVLISDVNGGPPRVKGMARDITNEVQTAREKKSLKKKLVQAQKMESIGTLAGGVAHDFNNILASILGFTELALKEVPAGSIIEDNLLEALKAGNRAKDLVNQILTFARQSDQKVEPIQVSLIAKEVLKLLRSTIPAPIHIKQDIKSDSLIMGNPTQVHQIFMNLCTNAAHAMEDKGGLLEVGIENADLDEKHAQAHPELNPGPYLKITVSDNGKGIHPDNVESIFEPYFTTKEQGRGTGLGLATVHGIVKGYGGEITVESEQGAGSVFSVYLPIVKIPVKSPPVKSTMDRYEQLTTGAERILFIDDESSETSLKV